MKKTYEELEAEVERLKNKQSRLDMPLDNQMALELAYEKLQELTAENKRLTIENNILLKAPAVSVHPDYVLQVEHENKELTAICTAQAEALVALMDDIKPCSAPNRDWKKESPVKGKYGIGSKTMPDDDSIYKALQALSSPPSQKLLRRMEVYGKAVEVLKFAIDCENGTMYRESASWPVEARKVLQQAKEAGILG